MRDLPQNGRRYVLTLAPFIEVPVLGDSQLDTVGDFVTPPLTSHSQPVPLFSVFSFHSNGPWYAD
jgi:hypothetical protein